MGEDKRRGRNGKRKEQSKMEEEGKKERVNIRSTVGWRMEREREDSSKKRSAFTS